MIVKKGFSKVRFTKNADDELEIEVYSLIKIAMLQYIYAVKFKHIYLPR